MANEVLYGFDQLSDRLAERVTEVGVSEVSLAIDQAIAEHNRQIDAMLALFAQQMTDFKTRFHTPSAARLSGLDEHGRARPIRAAGHYDVAFPLQMGGVAWGASFIDRQKMLVSEVMEATYALMMADARWVRDHVLAALYTNVSFTFADPEHGDLAVQGLANGDTVKYLIMAGADQGATDNHYLAQVAAIADATNPYPVIRDELLEHPENVGEVVCLIPSNLRAATQALTSYLSRADANVRVSANDDVLIGDLGVSVPGKLIGYVNECWIVEWRALPSDYIIATTSQSVRPLAMREDAEASLRGFRRVADREDYPFFESQYVRRAGFGGWNRVGALVYRIGNASYAIPTNYTSPMA